MLLNKIFVKNIFMGNKNLNNAKMAKNDEFYTQYPDIQKEIDAYLEYDPNVFKGKTILLPCDDPEWSNFTKFFAQNFEKLGLKKLISTCYVNTKQIYLNNDCLQNFNSHGKILVITKENLNSKWQYLKGDGDFRSSEIKALRDESDFIITNPPFSLFREFVSWIFETDKKFLIIGNMNAITYKEVFTLFKDNKMWLGKGFKSMVGHFINKFYTDYATASDHKEGMIRVPGVVWFTNLEHGIKHKPLLLLTMNDNLRFNKKLKNPKYQNIYKKYDNYDAIEIPLTEAIPSDYDGVMGVPITFLNKYCPEQFEIIDISSNLARPIIINGKRGTGIFYVNGKGLYDRIAIRKIK